MAGSSQRRTRPPPRLAALARARVDSGVRVIAGQKPAWIAGKGTKPRGPMEDEELHELAALYALDALDPEDERVFERHLSGCERCRREVESLRDAAGALAYVADPAEPPPGLNQRILAAARAERVAAVVPLPRRLRLRAAPAIAAVAACAVIGLGIWAVSLSRSLDREQTARRRDMPALELLSRRDVRIAQLSGRNGALLVTSDGEAALILSGVPRAPAGKAYEAWVVGRGRPQPAGLFPGGPGRPVARITRPVPRGAVVGVTLERAEGSERVTGRILFSGRV
jgi:anti-sigma factor RsiW